MNENSNKLKKQITDAAGNVQYTYIAHWNIVNRLEKQYQIIKVLQIILTALSACGFIATIISGVPKLSWIGGLTAVISLGLNLYMLNFNLPEKIKQHIDAANELWEIKECYKSLIVDFDDIDMNEVRDRRNKLIQNVSRVNKKYLGTDEKSFKKAQTDISKYVFEDNEVEKILHINSDQD